MPWGRFMSLTAACGRGGRGTVACVFLGQGSTKRFQHVTGMMEIVLTGNHSRLIRGRESGDMSLKHSKRRHLYDHVSGISGTHQLQHGRLGFMVKSPRITQALEIQFLVLEMVMFLRYSTRWGPLNLNTTSRGYTSLPFMPSRAKIECQKECHIKCKVKCHSKCWNIYVR